MQTRQKSQSPQLAIASGEGAPDRFSNTASVPLRRIVEEKGGHEGVALDPKVVGWLTSLFGDAAVIERLATIFEERVRKTISERAADLIESDRARLEDPLWLLDEVQYMGYVNFIGNSDGTGTFESLTSMLDHVMSSVGAKVLYALPFLASPFGDAGFDVSDYRSVDERFGGLEQFRSFRAELAKRGGSLQMDLVLNHVSEEHEWARRARAGDAAYRSCFHIREEAPDVVEVTLDPTGLPLSARYRERDESGAERTFERRVVFPAFANPAHPHYTKLKDANGHDIWVFHTFYPFQWDLNYSNPRVIEEAIDILSFWVNEGADVLRLDAIPHLFKQMESDPRIMKVVELLRYFVARTAPRTAVIVEANQSPSVVLKYFGEPASIEVDHLGKTLETSSGAQVAYNFDQTIHSWASLLTGDKRFLLDGIRRTPKAPAKTLWAQFLRVHDELSLSKAPEEIREVIQRELIESGRGVPFRGARGVGGRMANFLDRDVRRQNMAFAHLLSPEGHPIIYYGDEVMAPSDSNYAKAAAAARGGAYDSRDEGRGPISRESIEIAHRSGVATPPGEVLTKLRHLIRVRRERVSLTRGTLQIVETNLPSVAAYLRKSQAAAPAGRANGGALEEATLVVLNLSGHRVETELRLENVTGFRDGTCLDLVTGEPVRLERTDSKGSVSLEPYQALWLCPDFASELSSKLA